MNPDTQKVIQDLAQQLGVAASHIVAVLTRQMALEGLWYTPACALGLLASLVASVVVLRLLWNAARSDHHDAGFAVFVLLLVLTVPLCGVIFFGDATIGSILKLQNPEYYAIERVMRLVAR